MIKANNITKHYGDFCALKDISFNIEKGEIVGFLGRNGAGKTTLMRIMTTYLHASKGTMLVGDEDVKARSLAVRRKIGYLPETPPLYPDMEVRSYLQFAAQIKEIPAKLHSAQVDRVLDECNLWDVERKTISKLSKGFKQRVGIAQAIINEPELLILDEPTSGLDPVQILQVRDLIKNLECKRTVVLSTHILSEIEQIAKRVMIINDGELVADENIQDLLVDKDDSRKMLIRAIGKEQDIEEAVKKTNSMKQINIDYINGEHFLKVEITNHVKNLNELINNIVSSGAE